MSNPNYAAEPANNCEAVQALIPEYAFGLTDLEQARLVEANLASCPEASAQLADYRQIQDEMRSSVPQIEPPPQLGERLMAAIAAPEPKLQTAPRRRPIPLAWVAAVAAVIALIVTNGYWLGRVADLVQRNNILLAQNPPVQGSNAFVLTSTDMLRWARLPASQVSTDASAFLMWNGESEIGLLYVRGFEDMARGEVYQLWLTRGDDKVNAGTFSVDEKGIGTLLFHVTEPIDKFTWAHITDEGTGTIVANGQLPVNE